MSGRGHSRGRRRERWGDNGFEAWGGYMAAKKAKLEEQFSDDVNRRDEEDDSGRGIFSGVAIFVNGYTNPSGDELKRIMMTNGGIYHHYFSSRKTTHIIATNLPDSKVKALKGDEPICHPNWIVESLKAQKLLDFRSFLLYSSESKTQPKLKFEPVDRKPNMSKEEPRPSTSASSSRAAVAALDANDARFLGEFYNNSRLHHISTMGANFKKYVAELREKSDGFFPGRSLLKAWCSGKKPEDGFQPICGGQMLIMHIDMDCFFVSVGLRNRPDLVGKPVAVAHARGNREASATNVALRKAELRTHMKRRKNKEGKEEEEIHGDAEEKSSSPHLSADDFVEFSSMSELASVSYEARAAGVKNGTFLGTARKLCPDLVTIPYDFDGYQEVARVLYDTVSSLTLDIQAVSCDEMLADITDVVNSLKVEPLHVAEFLREEIYSKTRCKASVGLGSSILLARVATRRAKPDGKYHLQDDQAEEFMRSVSVGELPGVGRVNARRLKELKVEKCQDMQALSMSQLQKEFGAKVGKSFYGFCRGHDERKINLKQERKSVSAEVNYGIRFRCEADFEGFLDRLSAEVADRLENAGCVGGGRCVTLKLMVRAKDAPEETSKFLGHGVCDSLSRSCTLSSATRDARVIAREAKLLGGAMSVKCQDLRGIGIQLSKLEFGKPEGAASKSILSYITKKAEEPFERETKSPKRVTDPSCIPKGNIITFSQIDPEVLTALPQELRAEVEATYSKREKAKEADKSGRSRESILDATISQLDQDYLSALPMDVAEEVKQQLVENRIRQSAAADPEPSTSSSAFAAIMCKSPTKELTPKRGKKRRGRPPKNSPRFIKSSAKSSTKVSKELFKEETRAVPQELEVSDADVASVERNNLKSKEEAEVSLDGETELEKVKLLVKVWMRSCPSGPTSDDLTAVKDYFSGVVRQKTRLSQLPVLLKMMTRISADLGYAWTDAVSQISSGVQDHMLLVFGHKLRL